MSNDMLWGGAVSDESTGNSFKFGLNQGVKLLSFDYNGEIELGKSGLTASGIESEIEVNGFPMRNNILIPTKVTKDGVEIIDPNHPEMKKAQNIIKQRMFHIAKCFADEQDIFNALAVPAGSFENYANLLKSTFEEGWQEKELDLFLQYQWQLKEGAEKKYMEIPKKVSQGAFLVPSVAGNWRKVLIVDGKATYEDGTACGEVEDKTLKVGDKEITLPKKDTGMCYLNENFELHPFTRSEWFMGSGWAQADDGAEETLGSW